VKTWKQRFASGSFSSAIWMALCFALTSGIYLAWLGRLVTLAEAATSDWFSLVIGYLFQALGCYLASRMLGRPGGNPQREAAFSIALLAAVSMPAVLTDSVIALLIFGWIMNLLCGFLGGYYLYAIAIGAAENRRGLAFGGGYAAATVVIGAFALIGDGVLVKSGRALLLYLPLAAFTAWVAFQLPLFQPMATPSPSSSIRMAKPDRRDVFITCLMVVLISAVKNLGFSFPSADIQAGLIPQLSRLPYAVGLVMAGLIIDKKRANGMICTLAALALPFIMLGLLNELLPSTLLWGLDYLFFGFFSVFRVILLIDIAVRTKRLALAPLGLLAGRVGDAVGTAAALLLAERQVALIALCTLAFVPAVFLLFKQFQKLYEPVVTRQRDEKEVFESFCMHNDLSSREREILTMLLSGHSNAEIAGALFITENTVKYHVRNVLQKTGCKNRYELQKKYKLALYPDMEERSGSLVNGEGGNE